MKLREKILVVFIALVYLTGQWGCAAGRYEYPEPEPLSEEYREQLGTIGVTTGPDVAVIQFDRPLPLDTGGVLERMGRGTVEGAGKSWDWWLDLCLKPFEREVVENRQVGVVIGQIVLPVVYVGVCYILTVPVTIFGSLGGFFGGAFPPGEPPEYEETEAILRHTLANYPIQETLQNAFLKEARARTSHTFVVVPEEGPQTDEGMVGQSVDTVLELSVQRIWLKGVDDREGEMNPPMVLALVVRARLVRGTEKTVWYDQTFVQETKKRLYKEWPYYYRFRTDIEKALQSLAEQLVNELFYKTSNVS